MWVYLCMYRVKVYVVSAFVHSSDRMAYAANGTMEVGIMLLQIKHRYIYI